MMIPVGVGAGTAMPSATALLLNSVPSHQSGIASGVLNTCRQVGGEIAIAPFGTLTVGLGYAHSLLGQILFDNFGKLSDTFPMSQRNYRQQARFLKALAHPTRLQLIDELAAGERPVGELAVAVDVSPSVVSKHLSLLRSQGIVDDRREGNFIYYRLVTPCVLDFFTCTAKVLF